MKTSKPPAAQPQPYIDLSTVYFYKGEAPEEISLKDCGLQTKRAIPEAFAALYGYQGKQEGFVAASAYAESHRLSFTIIDLQVRLDHKQNPLNMKPQDLARHDFLTFLRLSKDMAEEAAAILAAGAESRKIIPGKPQLTLAEHPELISVFMNEPGWEHLKVLTFAGRLTISEKPLPISAIPYSHWDAIESATCRLDPNFRVTLDAPNATKAKTKTPGKRAAARAK